MRTCVRPLLVLMCLSIALTAVNARTRSADATVRSAVIDRDPVIAAINSKIASEGETACLLNEMGIALARRAFFDEAEEAFRRSLRASPDPVVYTNLGSVYLNLRQLGQAESAFKRAIHMDKNFALAHYNLGATHEAAKQPYEAIESYKRALELDPSLGDPAVNPQVVNNRYMVAVKTQRYQDTIGSLGLPLKSTCPQAPNVAGASAQPPGAAGAASSAAKQVDSSGNGK